MTAGDGKVGDRLKQKHKRKAPLILAAVGAALLLLVVVLLLINAGRERKNRALVQEGVAFLQSLEEKDPAVVDTLLKERRQAELAAMKEALLQQLYNGEIDVWSLFEDYALLGDSRAVGFSYYGCLEPSRVFADGGDTIRKIEEHIDELKALNPSYIFLCYGLNDVSIGFWNTPEVYAAEMIEIVSKLNEELPNATVIVSSILPARDPAFDLSSKWREIPQYSAAVESACQEYGVVFVNNDKIAKDHADLYDIDGIHLQIGFYDYWGSNLITAALEHSGGLETAGEG